MPIPSFKGQKDLQTQSSDFNTRTFHIRQELSKLSTSTLVQVIDIHVDGRVSPVGYVDVKPLVDQMDGQGNPVEHGIIYNVPYVRIQGGNNAFIIDPQIGDIGMCNFADRDISRVKKNKVSSLPGSKRLMSMADGLYTGGLLNGTPERYVLIDNDGIEIEGSGLVHIHADNVSVDCANAEVTASASITMEAVSQIDLTAPTINLNGITNVSGVTNANAGISVTGSATSNGKNFGDTHGHTQGADSNGDTQANITGVT